MDRTIKIQKGQFSISEPLYGKCLPEQRKKAIKSEVKTMGEFNASENSNEKQMT